VIWKRERWAEKKNMPWNITFCTRILNGYGVGSYGYGYGNWYPLCTREEP